MLGLYLLKNKGFTSSQIALLWSAISITNILLQIPSGFLADKKKNISFLLCILLNTIGFSVIISNISSIYVIIGGVLLINTGCTIYTTAMSALFGDLTTKESRLSESESYRMIRGIGEGILTITLTFVFDKSPILALTIIGTLVILGTIITLIINSKFQRSFKCN
ncbi:MFS transporter [Hathewaya limosa]|uniref:MFS transporter n=1 Tax=Hathewaya limosa TaxID=1536 RepID=UPI0030EBC63D